MWEWYTQRAKIRTTLGIIAILFASMVMSCQELRYKVWGKTVDATLRETILEKTPEGKTRVARYSFNDGENFRQEYQRVPLDWEGQDKPTVQIQYLPNKECMSRITSLPSTGIWLVIFFTSLLAAIAWVLLIIFKK